VPEYTLDEMRDQARKAAVYFERGMEGFPDAAFISVRSGDTVVVVARREAGEKLAEFVEEGELGTVTKGVEDVHQQGRVAEGLGAGLQTQNDGGSTPPAPSLPVVLLPCFHEPSGEYRGKGGQVHLHTLSDHTFGRRVRKAGECLCSKKRGSRERTPTPDETKMCGECASVAKEHNLTWEAWT
jgi:hypothetical protein